MTMEIIPIKHDVSKEVENDLDLAALYASAGMEKMAKSIRRDCVETICNDNGIPLIRSDDHRDHPNHMMVTHDRIYRWGGLDWEIKDINSFQLPVPVPILQKMGLIKDQSRLKIAVSRNPDPVLLYQLPFFNGPVFIELARWK